MILGFTGTRRGMTRAQQATLERYLLEASPDSHVLHHGDGGNSDCQAATLAREHGWYIVGHPASHPRDRERSHPLRCFFPCDEVRPLAPPLVRNEHVVAEIDRLIAAAATFVEEIRSGTWHTVRAAVRQGKPVWIIWPDGRMEPWPKGVDATPEYRPSAARPAARSAARKAALRPCRPVQLALLGEDEGES